MIRPLRRMHPWWVALLGLSAGAVLVGGLPERAGVPTAALPAALASPAVSTLEAWDVLLEGEPTIRVRRTGRVLLVNTEGVLEVPEPRLSWTPATGGSGRTSLGGLRGRGVERFDVPPGAGRLTLTSLGHREVLAELSLLAEGGP